VGIHESLLAYHSFGFLMIDFMPVGDASGPYNATGLLKRAAEANNSGRKRLEWVAN
jgi:hypothetical protein